MWVILTFAGIFAIGIILLCAGANEIERRWERHHPPDDGMSEVRLDDENSGKQSD